MHRNTIRVGPSASGVIISLVSNTITSMLKFPLHFFVFFVSEKFTHDLYFSRLRITLLCKRKGYRGGSYKHQFLSKIFRRGAYRGPHQFFPKIAYIGVIFKVAKI